MVFWSLTSVLFCMLCMQNELFFAKVPPSLPYGTVQALFDKFGACSVNLFKRWPTARTSKVSTCLACSLCSRIGLLKASHGCSICAAAVLLCCLLCCLWRKAMKLCISFRCVLVTSALQGCGIVTYDDASAAAAALQNLHGKHMWPESEVPIVVEWMDAAKQKPSPPKPATASKAAQQLSKGCSTATGSSTHIKGFGATHCRQSGRSATSIDAAASRQHPPPAFVSRPAEPWLLWVMMSNQGVGQGMASCPLLHYTWAVQSEHWTAT